MTSNARNDVKESCDDWAKLLSGPNAPAAAKERAMEALTPEIEEIAKNAAKRARCSRDEQIVGEALAIIWKRIDRYDPARGKFRSWCWTVLYNAFLDRTRRKAVVTEAEAVLASEPAEPGNAYGEDIETWLDRRRRTRVICDEIACKPKGSEGVHLYAVFLMRLRQAMTIRVGGHKETRDVLSSFNVNCSEFIQWCAPWHHEESQARFRSRLPTLIEIWGEVRPTVDRPPHRVDSPVLCDCITHLTHKVAEVAPKLWNRWVNRAKGKARSKIDANDWDELFAPLLPDWPTAAGRAFPA